MSKRFTVSIPESWWIPIQEVPRDGSIVFVADEDDVVDLAYWDGSEWNSEFGLMNKEPVRFAILSITRTHKARRQ